MIVGLSTWTSPKLSFVLATASAENGLGIHSLRILRLAEPSNAAGRDLERLSHKVLLVVHNRIVAGFDIPRVQLRAHASADAYSPETELLRCCPETVGPVARAEISCRAVLRRTQLRAGKLWDGGQADDLLPGW